MGFALEKPGDTVTVRRSDGPGVSITRVTGGGAAIPLETSRNTAGPPVVALAQECGYRGGLEIEIGKGSVPGSGLGSSAASAVAAAVACNDLLEAGFPERDLLRFALAGEEVASGAVHADNVAPSLLGGFILVRGYDPLDVVRLEPPPDLCCAVILPHSSIATLSSRKLLPASLPLKDIVTQTGNAAGLVAGILLHDFALIGRSLHDVIAEPVRAGTIKGFNAMKRAALDAGALGCSISGSGPAVFALTPDRQSAERVAEAMGRELVTIGLPHDILVSRINPAGAVTVS